MKVYIKFIRIITIMTIFNCAVLPGTAQSYIQYVDSADFYIKRKMWNDAERMTLGALKQFPANKLNYLLWSNLGDIRLALGKTEDALQAFDIGVIGAPENTNLLNKRAHARFQAKMDSLALRDLDKSLEIDSVQRWPLRTRGMWMLSQKRYDIARNDFETLKRHFPLDEGAYMGLGQLEAINGNSEKALEMYDKALELNANEETWFYKITIEIESDKLEKAEDDLRYSLKRFPRCGNLYLLRGLIHKIKFQNEAAEIDRKIALEYGSDPLVVEKILPSNRKQEGNNNKKR